MDEDKLKNNLEFLEEQRFINQVNLVNLLILDLMVGIEIILRNTKSEDTKFIHDDFEQIVN